MPTGDLRFIRSDCPEKLGFDDQTIIDDYMESKENLLDFLTDYVHSHPQVDINIIIPNEKNIRKVLDALS